VPRVISEQNRNPRVRTVEIDRPPPQAASFLRATMQGLGVTMKHFFRNVVAHEGVETFEYPEEKEAYPPRHRGLHRLMTRDDGRVRCVACMCCPTVCPAHCITIIPAETDDASVEKYPAVFEIDELRCIVCGLCEEACPCDAIRMDSGTHAKPVEVRGDAIMTKDLLLGLSRKVGKDPTSIATQGGEGANWREGGGKDTLDDHH
jgi:NADH-quinone oxidoreductase subunit I